MLEKLRPAAVAAMGPDHVDICRIDHNLGGMYAGIGDYEAGLEASERALACKRKVLGADHPSVATSANNIGDAHDNLGHHRESIGYYEEALRVWGDSPERIYALHGLARAYLAMGDNDEALARANEGVQVMDQTSANGRERGRILFAKAQALLRTGGDRDEAAALGRKALEAFTADEGDLAKEIGEVKDWLDDPS